MQKGVFTITPDSGTGDGNIRVSAPLYKGRVAPTDAAFRLRKVGGGLETRRLTVRQPAYPEYFKITSLTTAELPNGKTDIVVECEGNVLISSVVCAARDFYGLSPTVGKSWEVWQGTQQVGSFSATLRSDGFGVNVPSWNGSNDIGATREYKLKAYLTAPENTDTTAKQYDFYFGVPVWGNEVPSVGQYPTPTSTLDSASSYSGKIVIQGSGTGSIVVGPNTVSFNASDVDPVFKQISVFASGAWEVVAASVPSWLDVRVTGNTIILLPKSTNTSTENRVANISVQLTNAAASATCRVTQNGVAGESFEVSTVNYKHYLEFKSAGMTSSFRINTSGPFTLNTSELPSWITIGSVDYSGEISLQDVSITIDALSDSDSPRTFDIVGTLSNSNITSSLIIYQRHTDQITVTSSDTGALVDLGSNQYRLTLPSGGTSVDVTLGISANCLWHATNPYGDYSPVTETSSSYTLRLSRSSAASETSHFIGFQGEHNDIVGYVAGVTIVWPGA